MAVTLLEAKLEDCVEIHKMQIIAFKPLLDHYQDYEASPGAETVEIIMERMSKYPSLTHYFIILQEDKIGHIRINRLSETVCRFSQMFILPEYQGNGYAQQAIGAVERLHPEVIRWELDTIKQEPKLRHLYEKMGYKLTGKESNIKEGMDLVYYAK